MTSFSNCFEAHDFCDPDEVRTTPGACFVLYGFAIQNRLRRLLIICRVSPTFEAALPRLSPDSVIPTAWERRDSFDLTDSATSMFPNDLRLELDWPLDLMDAGSLWQKQLGVTLAIELTDVKSAIRYSRLLRMLLEPGLCSTHFFGLTRL